MPPKKAGENVVATVKVKKTRGKITAKRVPNQTVEDTTFVEIDSSDSVNSM